MAKDRSRTGETVYSVTQRERSRPFKSKLTEYAKNVRKQISKPKISRTYVTQPNLSIKERLKRTSEFTKDRASGGITRAFSLMQKGGVTRALYGQPISPYGSNISNTIPSRRTGRRGRPKGTYDQRYANFGGVYGYRKFLAQQRWKERQQILQNSVTNPRQKAILRQIQQRDEMQRMSPESRTIPDTAGNIPTMRTIHDEINDYANIFS